MRVVGIDPSSSCCGIALLYGDHLAGTDAWHRPKTGSAVARLAEYFDWLTLHLAVHQPDMACIEFLGVERNAQTTRVISHYQAASAIVCKRAGLVVVEARVSSARKAALGRGDMSKEECWVEVKRRYPEHDFGRKTKAGASDGGMDRSDAVVLALACAELAEGR